MIIPGYFFQFLRANIRSGYSLEAPRLGASKDECFCFFFLAN